MRVILPQRVPLTEKGELISREWSRALEDLADAVATAGTSASGSAYANFTGDSGSGGSAGLVPAPRPGDASKVLRGNGTWGPEAAAVPGPAGLLGPAGPAGPAGSGLLYDDTGRVLFDHLGMTLSEA